MQARFKPKRKTSILVWDFGKAQPCADGISQALVSSLPVSQRLLQHTRQNQGIPKGVEKCQARGGEEISGSRNLAGIDASPLCQRNCLFTDAKGIQNLAESALPLASGLRHQHPLLPAVLPSLEPRTSLRADCSGSHSGSSDKYQHGKMSLQIFEAFRSSSAKIWRAGASS